MVPIRNLINITTSTQRGNIYSLNRNIGGDLQASFPNNMGYKSSYF